MNSNDLNNDQLASYYIERLRQCDQSWDELCTSQRQEIARLQQECNNLRLQQTMQRASVAEEISQFCIRLANCAGTNRLGGITGNSSTTNTNTNTSSSSSSSLRGGSNITSGGRNTAPSTTPLQSLLASRHNNNHQNQNQNQQRNNNNNINNNNNNRLIPLRAIIRFLNRYTDGMVMDQTFTQEKRLRDDSAASPILTPAKIPGGSGESQQQQQQQNNNNNNNNNNNLQHQQNGSSATSSTTTNARRATGFVYPELQAVQPTSRRHLPEFFDGDEDDFVDDFEEVDLDENDQNNNNNIQQQQQNQNQNQNQQQQQQQSSTSEGSCRGQEYMFQQQQQQQQQRFSGGSNGQLCPDD